MANPLKTPIELNVNNEQNDHPTLDDSGSPTKKRKQTVIDFEKSTNHESDRIDLRKLTVLCNSLLYHHTLTKDDPSTSLPVLRNLERNCF